MPSSQKPLANHRQDASREEDSLGKRYFFKLFNNFIGLIISLIIHVY